MLVVPAYEEDLESCFASLGSCDITPDAIGLIVVLNNAEGSDLKKLHKTQYKQWHGRSLANGLKVQVILADDLSPKHAGVGLARKIGMDAAFALMARNDTDGLIVCLDADCEVESNYLKELLRAEKEGLNGLSIYFEHPLKDLDSERSDRIAHYEIWLRYYIQALRGINYPHAFHTVGSSMAVRASVYGRIGGMNRRKAGEDFYFLHKLIPQGKFMDLTSTCVYPSARDSTRVPFGTGRAMLDSESGKKDFSMVYNPEIFLVIKALLLDHLSLIKNPQKQAGTELLGAIKALGWLRPLEELCARSRNDSLLLRNFNYWFDGFKMLKLVHWLQEHYFPPVDALDASAKLLNMNTEGYLDLLITLREKDREFGEK